MLPAGDTMRMFCSFSGSRCDASDRVHPENETEKVIVGEEVRGKRFFLEIETKGQDAKDLQDWLKRIDVKKLAELK